MYNVVCNLPEWPQNRYFYTDDVLTVEKAIFHAMWARNYHLTSYHLIMDGVEYCFANPKGELLYVYRFKEQP